MDILDLKNQISFNNDWQAYLKIRVIPKSQKVEIVDFMDDGSVKIRLKSAPEQWKANKELEKFLLKGLSLKNIEIISWKSDRTKLVRLFK